MLIDQCRFDRARRIADLLRSDIPAEQEAGTQEVAALLEAVPNFWELHHDALRALVQAAPATTSPTIPTGPDTEWTMVQRRGLHHWVRCHRGQVLVVRLSGSYQGGWYPVVDGHYLSDIGGPPKYTDLSKAMMAAENATSFAG